VVGSIVLYGAPVWHAELRASRVSRDDILAVQRILALRVARGYCTVAREAAMVLAKQIPWDKQAEARARIYH